MTLLSPDATATTRWQVKVAVVALSSMLTLAALAVAGELFLRYRERHRDTVPGTQVTLFYRHDRLGHALVRNMDYFGWIHTNGQGFRGIRPTNLDAKGAFRIMALGASTTFDTFVTGDENAWPAQLERQLTNLGTGRRVEVLNAGVPGYVLGDNMIRWHNELYRYHPDLLILSHGGNELLNGLRSALLPSGASTDRPGEIEPMVPWTAWLTRHSMVYGKIVAKWKAVRWVSTGQSASRQAALTPAAWHAIVDANAREYARDLEAFVKVAQLDSVRIAILEMVDVTPSAATHEPDSAARVSWQVAVASAPVDVVLYAVQAYNEVTRTIASRNGIRVIHTSGFGIAGPRWYSGDPFHFNNAGAERMAALLAPALVEAGLVPGPGADLRGGIRPR